MSSAPRRPPRTTLMAQFQSFLTTRGLKSTEQRCSIAALFFSSKGHLSLDDVLLMSRREHPRIGYATVYRTLRLLVECGLAAERQFGDGITTYEVAGDTGHHDHLICMECGYVLEFYHEPIEREQEQIARGFGFQLVRHRHELYGLCARARGIRGGSCPAREPPPRTEA